MSVKRRKAANPAGKKRKINIVDLDEYKDKDWLKEKRRKLDQKPEQNAAGGIKFSFGNVNNADQNN